MNMGAQFHMECPKATPKDFGTYPLTITSKSFVTANTSCAHIENKGERKIWK